MNVPRSTLVSSLMFAAALSISLSVSAAQTATPAPVPAPHGKVKESNLPAANSYPAALVQRGSSLFRQDCSFCHGRDAGGGESGPDLTRSRLVTSDVGGNRIGPVVRSGRPDKGMPPFDLSDQQIAGLVAFIHTQQNLAPKQKGGRRGVDAADLQSGNAEEGQQYFEGTGGCAACHSAKGDLAGIASRYQGLDLEKQMLYPQHAKSQVTVTLPSGQAITGTLEYLDEFTVGVMDATKTYRSWRIKDVQYKVNAPVEAHVDLFGRYTDADIHNLMAYLQTLR
jgi:cytochrome c oxidase cbb3-type subunit III